MQEILKAMKTMKDFDRRGFKEMKLELQQAGLDLLKARQNLAMPQDDDLIKSIKEIIWKNFFGYYSK